jgi:hypothetical protein
VPTASDRLLATLSALVPPASRAALRALDAADAWDAAADQLGSSYTSPYMWATTFRPGNHHGATYLRNLAFDEGCDCFKYVGKMYLPRA